MNSNARPLDNFAFIDKQVNTGTYSWRPKRTGCWSDDNEIGSNCADEIVKAVIAEDCPGLLGHVAKMIGQCSFFGGAEVGFFHRLAVLAAAGANENPEPIL